MFAINVIERTSRMLVKSRHDAGKSQSYMAKALGVSVKTIQNWESGYSSPSQAQGFAWFDVLGVQSLRYYFEVMHAEEFCELSAADGSRVDTALQLAVNSLPLREKKQLLYQIYSSHQSSAAGLQELIACYLQIPLANRIAIAQAILTTYELQKETDAAGTEVLPDTDLLQEKIDEAIQKVRRR